MFQRPVECAKMLLGSNQTDRFLMEPSVYPHVSAPVISSSDIDL